MSRVAARYSGRMDDDEVRELAGVSAAVGRAEADAEDARQRRNELLARHYRAGASASRLAEITGLGRQRIHTALAGQGVPVRDRAGPRLPRSARDRLRDALIVAGIDPNNAGEGRRFADDVLNVLRGTAPE